MTITYKDGASTRSISAVYYKDGATQRTVKELWVGDGGTKRLVFSSFAATANTPVSGSRATSGIATSGAALASTVDGTSPFTYSWSLVSGGTGITITSPTAASTTFSGSVGPVNNILTGVYKCTVTDNSGAVVDTNTVSVTLTYTGP